MSWEYSFYIFGAIGACWGIPLLLFLTNEPTTSPDPTLIPNTPVNEEEEQGEGLGEEKLQINDEIEASRNQKVPWIVFLFTKQSFFFFYFAYFFFR